MERAKYIKKSSKRQRTYVIGDLIGLKVADVDRTNTSSIIVPCKIFHSKAQSEETMYNVATVNGIIDEIFSSVMIWQE